MSAHPPLIPADSAADADTTADPVDAFLNAPNAADNPPSSGDGLTPVAPRYRWVIRASLAVNALLLLALAAAGDVFLAPAIGLAGGLLTVCTLFALMLLIWIFPTRRVASIAYHISDDHLRLRRGFLFRVDTIVPFVRVQHLDVRQGPVERALCLSRLIVYTSGVLNQAVVLPGLESDLAASMREAIHRRILTDFE